MAAAKVEYTHNSVNAISRVPMITATSMLPWGKYAGACKNRKTAPTAIFIPKVFMIKASNTDTSRSSPVALRRNIPPELPTMPEEALSISCALLSVRRADEVQHPIIPPEALNGEKETVGSIEHLRKFHELVCYVILLSLHLQHRRSWRNTEYG